MDRVVIVGNCQAKALEMMLSTNGEFMKRFEFVSFPPVHEIPPTMVPALHGAVTDAAVVILQQIGEDYRDHLGLGTETLAVMSKAATVVRWPSVYWSGYFPDLFYLRDGQGEPVVDGPFDYHDRSILQAYAAGYDVGSTCRLLEDPERPSDAQARAAKATDELDIRGQNCDVQVTSFIETRFRSELLFFTMNHPTNRLLAFIAQQVIELIGIPGHVDQRQILDEILGLTFYPLHINHVRALELEFGADQAVGCTPYRIRGVSYAMPEAVHEFYRYFSAHPELVELNVVHGTGMS